MRLVRSKARFWKPANVSICINAQSVRNWTRSQRWEESRVLKKKCCRAGTWALQVSLPLGSFGRLLQSLPAPSLAFGLFRNMLFSCLSHALIRQVSYTTGNHLVCRYLNAQSWKEGVVSSKNILISPFFSKTTARGRSWCSQPLPICLSPATCLQKPVPLQISWHSHMVGP